MFPTCPCPFLLFNFPDPTPPPTLTTYSFHSCLAFSDLSSFALLFFVHKILFPSYSFIQAERFHRDSIQEAFLALMLWVRFFANMLQSTLGFLVYLCMLHTLSVSAVFTAVSSLGQSLCLLFLLCLAFLDSEWTWTVPYYHTQVGFYPSAYFYCTVFRHNGSC